MKNQRSVVGALLATMFLTACGGASTNPALLNSVQSPESRFGREPSPPIYTLLYSFGAYSDDGTFPLAGLLDVSGTLYGTTSEGGMYADVSQFSGGTVFRIATSGAGETVLHSFGGPKGSIVDGFGPYDGLIDLNGTLYGTTYAGGKYASSYPILAGTVFSVTTSGTNEKVLHSFGNGKDGNEPFASLLDVSGTLYSTTSGGGAYDEADGGLGTAFSVTTSGTEKVLHSFGHGTDGADPVANLINVKGTLYGTTTCGGVDDAAGKNCSSYSPGPGGTVFRITTSGAEKVLYSFGKGSDASNPEAGLININGTLYGTTNNGGAYGGGTVFRITPSGTGEKVLHSFGKGTDGAYPEARLFNVNDTLYGTTSGGGAYGGGTVFTMTTAGTGEKVLHSFGNGTDGENPVASLIDVSGTLYGTTENGGKYGAGALFSLKP